MMKISFNIDEDMPKAEVEKVIKTAFNDKVSNLYIPGNNTEGSYYDRHREEVNRKNKEYYAKKHPRKYCSYYTVTSPDGNMKNIANMADLVKFFGYTEQYLRKKLKESNEFAGYIIEKKY